MELYQKVLSQKLVEGYDEGQIYSNDDVPSVLRKVEKWGTYDSMGEPVGSSKFIPMKTPFSNEIMNSIKLEAKQKQILHKHTVDSMLSQQSAVGREIGMILDVSDHTCLYSQDIPNNVEYQQVRLVAKQLPTRDVVRKVHLVAKEFWVRCPEKYIAIHCAYGFNRTGFLVCAYLVEVMDVSVEEALHCFEVARSPGIRHEKFVEELIKRYNGTTMSGATTSSNASTVPLDLQTTSFNHVPHFEHLPFAKSHSHGEMEVDNDSLGFEQREVLSALYQEHLQQQLRQEDLSKFGNEQIIQQKSYPSRISVQDMYWGLDDQQQIDQNDLIPLGDDAAQLNFEQQEQQQTGTNQQQQQQQQQQQKQQQGLQQLSQVGFLRQIGRFFSRQTA